MIFKQVSHKFSEYQSAMISEQSLHYVLVLACLLLLPSSSTLIYAQPFHNSTSKLPTTWVNQPSVFANGTDVGIYSFTPILLRENTDKTAFVCGFCCTSNYPFDASRGCVFGVVISRILENNTFEGSSIQSPRLVWSANRNNLVAMNATLGLSEEGDLTLKKSDGTLVWSSDTGGKAVAGLNLTEDGNLVLFGRNNEPIWQSFDHPTDSLLVGQKLVEGQKLIASVSASNKSEGLFYVSIDDQGLEAYINSDPPQTYFLDPFMSINKTYAEFTSGGFFHHYYGFSSASRFLTLGPDGHLKVFGPNADDWEEEFDLLTYEACAYPLVCGRYGICSNAECSCLETTGGQGNFFTQKIFRQPDLGCSPVTPISCHHMKDHTLLELKNTYYFAFRSLGPQIPIEDCKSQCLNNCSCKAAVFGASADEKVGYCLLINEVFSIADNEDFAVSAFNSTLYLKVQHPHAQALRRRTVILASSLSALFGVISVIFCCLALSRKLRKKQPDEDEEDFLKEVPGMPTRYSYDDLKAATGDFCEKLGEGGFGSVYEGSLSNGTKVAVKCLGGIGKVKDSFLVEVKTIGSMHHVNLVKLIGFCFEKSHRALVYEFMANRSLDAWIFNRQENNCLPWITRRKIISEIAKGLAYLHEDCSQKIIHLDIKPQNILLDHNFNAKIGDFGLSKLIEKDQSKVVTTMRGTPGYLAPEWLNSVITEKVDIYSFGIVMMEIICGRKNLDRSKADEDEKHLLRMFKERAEGGNLASLVDADSEDMQIHVLEAVEMLQIAAWCLQGDFTKRPSMSTVVKVLEGLVEAETILDYDFLNPTIVAEGTAYECTEVLPSALSGPR